MMGEEYEGSVMDAAAQRVEHYEIAAYGCVHSWAQELGEEDAAKLLEKTLTEEKETDAKLTELAEQINASANSKNMNETEEEESESPVRKGKSRSANA
jgi:ferritin-like metal-binding protein YciE